MHITDVRATVHEVEAAAITTGEPGTIPFAFVEVETDEGITGYGESAYYPARAAAGHVNESLAPTITGLDPRVPEQTRKVSLRDDREPPGVRSAALSMIDIALWDIRGKIYEEPIWRLLGGTDEMIDVYVTLGTVDGDETALSDIAGLIVDNWSPRVKMVVSSDDDDATPAADARRIRAVRQAIGDNAELAIDGNGGYPIDRALDLVNRISDEHIAWYEEPVPTNDRMALADLRRKSPIPIAAGQFSGHRSRHWDLVRSGAIDLCQPNVCTVGGYTEGQKIANMAETANIDLAHAGGWPLQNMHLIGGSQNGRVLEIHDLSWAIQQRVYEDPPTIEDGRLTLPNTPGLGLEPDQDILKKSQVA